ncbi:MAG: GNAT family N-acetyltransferase [Eubacterium sp.]|nr:GNAT family N-acetyltransferase [Eubacterium sp.]
MSKGLEERNVAALRLKLITNDNIKDFEEILPEAFSERKELLGVACIDETGEEDVILGASVVFPNEEEDVLELQWMYVQPQYRRRGAGSRMLQGIRDMAKAAGLKLIDVCFWEEDTEEDEGDTWSFDPAEEPDDRWEDTEESREDTGESREDEYSEVRNLKDFLLEKGFLTMREYPIYSFFLSDVNASDYVRGHQKNKDSKALEAYDGVSWGKLSKSMRESVREKVIKEGFTDLTYLSSPEISFVCVKEGEIVGCLLSTVNPAEKLITVMLFISFTQDPICSAKLIAVTGEEILNRYPEDYRVAFIALNENTLKLLGTILDGRDRIRSEGYTIRGILEA